MLGTARWLTLMMGGSGVVSLVLLFVRRKQLRSLMEKGNAKWFVLGSGLAVGGAGLVGEFGV